MYLIEQQKQLRLLTKLATYSNVFSFFRLVLLGFWFTSFCLVSYHSVAIECSLWVRAYRGFQCMCFMYGMHAFCLLLYAVRSNFNNFALVQSAHIRQHSIAIASSDDVQRCLLSSLEFRCSNVYMRFWNIHNFRVWLTKDLNGKEM